MPMVKVLRKCYDGRRLLREGQVVNWRNSGPLPDYVELVDDDGRPLKPEQGKGKKGKKESAPVDLDEDDVI